MARMYPNQISPDTKSDAERRLYEAFRDELGDNYTSSAALRGLLARL